MARQLHAGRTLGIVIIGAAVLVWPHAGLAASTAGLTYGWRLVDGHAWQIDGDAIESTTETDAREGNGGACSAGMVALNGEMKLDGAASIEELQDTTCVEWIDRKYPARCARFDAAAWRRIAEPLKTRTMSLCIDRFESPNRRGEYPVIDVTWREAKASCEADGKRLCTETEWTFACEGDEATPYSTGYFRDANACVIDRPRRAVDERALSPRDGHQAITELDRLWQGAATGSHAACKSASGVYDLTGNVDEWTVSSRRGERPSILKGGYWGPVRDRCRPSTRAHGGDFSYYQQGYRCCQDRRE